jgi:hypothetical protein
MKTSSALLILSACVLALAAVLFIRADDRGREAPEAAPAAALAAALREDRRAQAEEEFQRRNAAAVEALGAPAAGSMDAQVKAALEAAAK